MVKNKVYIVNKGGHDYESASKYGELIVLSTGSIDKYAPSNIYVDFYEILKDSSPDDLILLSGLALVNTIAGGIMVALHGRINFLLYHIRNKCYIERNVVFSNKE